MSKINKFPSLDGNVGWYEISPNQGCIRSNTSLMKKTYDFVIVGAGFTGVSTAMRLAELNPKATIALIDALKVGQGTSGRNAGFMIDVPHILDSKEFNYEHDSKVFSLNTFAIKRIGDFVKEFNINADWKVSGKFLAANQEKYFGNIDAFKKILEALDAPHRIIEGKELQVRLGTDYYKKAIYTPGNILMNPASLILGLANALPGNVDIYEECPVRDLKLGQENVLQLDMGTIKAGEVVLTANAFNEAMHVSKNILAPIYTYASMTRPLNESEIHHFKNTTSYGLTSAHPAGSTLRLTVDNRIFIRNSFSFNASLNTSKSALERSIKQHRKSYLHRFPHLESVPFEYSWGGMLCMTLNHQTQFSGVSDHAYSIAGMNGVGLAKGTYLGYYMAEYISGKQSPDLDFILKYSKPSYIPPEPLRSIGAKIRLVYEGCMAGSEV